MQISRLNSVIFTTFILMGCSNSAQKIKSHKQQIQLLHDSGISEIKYLGDSVRIEIEKRGNYVVKHFIDLKGTKDDGFDNSYTVILNYKRRDIDSTAIIDKKIVQIKATLTEDYETEFSGGTNYYVIIKNGDTILQHSITRYIR